MIEIDGTFGEGGGQILRTSLALSAVTGHAFRIVDIRAGRRKSGLLRQHLTAARAVAEVCEADVDGMELGSTTLVFRPGDVRPGEYEWSVGSAGSSTLVLQTVLPALLEADSPSRVVVEGGTHNTHAPTFEFLRDTFAPALARAGWELDLQLEAHGFYPAGGGRIVADVQPGDGHPFEIMERGEITGRRAEATLAHLPDHIAERELGTVREKLSWPEDTATIRRVDDSSPGPGNVLTVQLESASGTATFVGFGQKGVPAETVAETVCDDVKNYLRSGAPVDEHLADQLILPMALAGGGRFRTTAPTRHTLTQIEIVPKFIAVDIDCERVDDDHVWEIVIEP
jgi:RNA 3'-terminal phosphate cyclase (ATP)